MRPVPKLLSKTKLMRGYRCLKCIYLTVHQPELEPPVTPELQALFDQGNAVGAEARQFFPGGVLIDNKPWDFGGALARTRKLLAGGQQIIYEAAFDFAGCYARADIIRFNSDSQRWQIYEVKSTTKVKPEHIDDIGLQAWIMAKSGLPIESIHLMHLNSACRYPDLSNLFSTEDVTDAVRDKYLSIQPKVRDIVETLRQPDVPDIDIGPYCTAPNDCGFVSHCWKEKNIPEISIFNLPAIKQRKWDLYRRGIISLDDPRLDDLTELQQRVVNVYKTQKRYMDLDAIKTKLSEWRFPLVFLDFETINPAIPRYDGTGPYQHVPFQFSVHIWPSPEAEVSHTAFLQSSAGDPRPDLIPALLDACGTEGDIVAYYGKFESERILELSEFSPNHAEALKALTDRIVDPLPILRSDVYDNAFGGSFSLKSVIPALLGEDQSYSGMLVANGGDAQRAFEEMISPGISADKKSLIEKALLDYCNKDTLVMVDLVKWLFNETLDCG